MSNRIKASIIFAFLFSSIFLYSCGTASHTHEYIETKIEATCENEGYVLHTCECGDSYKSDIVKKLGHKFTHYVSNNDAKCEEDGTKTAKCENCSATDTIIDEGTATGHKFINYKSNNDAKCEEDGTKTAKCENCEATNTITDEGTATGHKFINYKSNNDAECEKDGTKTAKCENCEATNTITDEGSATGHTYSSTWSYDDTYHYYKATCEHIDEKKDYAKHTIEDGICTICSYRQPIKAYDIILSNDEIEIKEGSSKKIYAMIFPSDAIDNKLTWTSSDTTIAKCLSEQIYAYKEGKTTITASNGRISVSCIVNVIANDPFEFQLTDDGYIVKGYTGNETNIIIPESFNGKPVIGIGDKAFEYNKSISSITIPSGVTYIGNNAFYGCSYLRNINLPNSLTEIKSYAFNDCSFLRNIILPEGVKIIGDSVFQDCSSLTNITIPYTLEKLGDYVFDNCNNLAFYNYSNACYLGNTTNKYLILVKALNNNIKNCSIANSTKFICNNAFEGIDTLSNVTFGSDLIYIGNYAFYGCSKIPTVSLPNMVIEIGDHAFDSCINLKTLILGNSITTIGNSAFASCGNLIGQGDTLIIRNNVITIGNNAFNSCASIRKIQLGDSIKTIGTNAFYNCVKITNISIPNSVEEIKIGAFSECSGLSSISFGNSLKLIDNYAFSSTSITKVILPNGVRKIGEGAFANCKKLSSISIPNTINYIGYNVVEGTSVKYNAFDNAYYLGNDENKYVALIKGKDKNISSCTINDNARVISSGYLSSQVYYGAFSNCGKLTSIVVPSGIINIGSYSFYNCSNLESALLNEGITSIEDNAFSMCANLKNVTIPKSVITIGNNSFYGCSSLANIIINEGTKYIGDRAFAGCSINNISIPNSIINIGYSFVSDNDTIKYNEYLNGKYLGNETNPYLVLISANDVTTFETHDNTKFIMGKIPGLYSTKSNLRKIIIKDNVKSIGKSAFANCYNLVELDLGNSLEVIDEAAFTNCEKLKNILLPASIKSIGKNAFYGCNYDYIFYKGTKKQLKDVMFENKQASTINYIYPLSK